MTPRDELSAAERELERAERLLEIAHVARRLSCCHESVRRLIRSGDLPAFKLKGGWRIKATELDAYLTARRFTPHNNLHRHPE